MMLEYMQRGSVFIKMQVSDLKNEFLERYFSGIVQKIKWIETKLNLLLKLEIVFR